MRKSATLAIALMLGAAPVAYSQPMNPPSAPPSHAATSAAFATKSGELRSSKLIGSAVYDVQNEKIGSVQDIILDKSGRATAVVVDVGAFLGVGGKDVAVQLSDLKMNNDRLTLDKSKDQLKSAPEYQL